MSQQWIKETMELLDDAESRRVIIQKKIQQLEMELVDLNEDIESWHKLVAAYQEKHNISPSIPIDVKVTGIVNMSYPEILTALAQKQGYLKVTDVVDYLFDLKMGKDKQAIRNNIYAALNRMTKRFIRIAPGQYRYINHVQERGDTKPSGVRSVVKELKDKNPLMTKKEVLNHLRRTGFDFKGKNPKRAVNMAWATLGYSKEGKQQSFLSET
ncbi:MAG: hypothetical protein FJ006_09015 [Chloroflexi bacterium]|nr:hypothetical protein [Chloroflexota bacterium]